MMVQRDRIVRRRPDGLLEIRPRGWRSRASPHLRGFATALVIVVVGTLAYTLFLLLIFVVVALLGAWAARALWRETAEARAALRLRPIALSPAPPGSGTSSPAPGASLTAQPGPGAPSAARPATLAVAPATPRPGR